MQFIGKLLTVSAEMVSVVFVCIVISLIFNVIWPDNTSN